MALTGHIGYDIAPSFRGRGYGKQMLKFALIEAKKLGITKVLITANEDNYASRRVIEAKEYWGRVLSLVLQYEADHI